MVDLRKDSVQVAELWGGSQDHNLPLSMAAAFTFHQTRRDGVGLLSPDEYSNALDIAAAALACLIPIYTHDGNEGQIPVSINLAQQKFCGGATMVRSVDGSVITSLSIMRADVLAALIAIERYGIEYLAPRRA